MLIPITLAVLAGLGWYLIRHGQPRAAAAFALAPLAPVVVGAVWGKDVHSMLLAAFSYPFALLPGIPAYFLFRRLGWLNIWQVALAALLLGGGIGFLDGFATDLHDIVVLCGNGLCTGLVFWLVAFAGQRSNQALQPTGEPSARRG